MILERSDIAPLSLGAQVLGGGGGGSAEQGLRSAAAALEMGPVELIPAEALPEEALVATVSGVGAPSRGGTMYTSAHYLRALELLEQRLGKAVAAFIPSEMGGNAAFGPFLTAAARGLPLVDAACDGRAHPLGTMGSLGLTREPAYLSIQAACGGSQADGTYTELACTGSVATAAGLCRQAADLAGGRVAVVRNPVTAGYLLRTGALGTYTQALALGRAMEGAAPADRPEAAMETLGGRVVLRGRVTGYRLISEGGLDHGEALVSSRQGTCHLTFYNEYMTLETEGERLATFPDLIATFDAVTGAVVTTAALREGMEIAVTAADRHRLLLADGVRDGALYGQLERIVDRPLVPYIWDILLEA